MDRLAFFSDCFKDLLLENDMTIKRLAEKTGISKSRLYDFVNRVHAPSVENAILIADTFGCTLDYLFGFQAEYVFAEHRVTDTVSARVKAAIDKSSVSRYQLHKLTSISEPQLLRWYHGAQIPTLVSLITLAEQLDCSLDFLVGRD